MARGDLCAMWKLIELSRRWNPVISLSSGSGITANSLVANRDACGAIWQRVASAADDKTVILTSTSNVAVGYT